MKLKAKTQLIIIKNCVKILRHNKSLPSLLCDEINSINKDTNIGYVSFLIKLTQIYIQPKYYYNTINDDETNKRIIEDITLFKEVNNL